MQTTRILTNKRNIPARYCNGDLADIGTPPVDAPMDISAWFEVYLEAGIRSAHAITRPRIGRVVIARGRDAAHVAMTLSFRPCRLTGFAVVCDDATDVDTLRAPGLIAAK
ncbi:hypothetical protein [Phenylobacterium sp.]|uniref:hypothetical protein n=1 Tax=Phenylobacterium sp. TaxID=1871053 RepID=UPI0025E706CF|nr:hypothetical protein [Phenylobacterium sp.]